MACMVDEGPGGLDLLSEFYSHNVGFSAVIIPPKHTELYTHVLIQTIDRPGASSS